MLFIIIFAKIILKVEIDNDIKIFIVNNGKHLVVYRKTKKLNICFML